MIVSPLDGVQYYTVVHKVSGVKAPDIFTVVDENQEREYTYYDRDGTLVTRGMQISVFDRYV